MKTVRKLFTILLLFVLISIASTSLVPNVQAEEASFKAKNLAVLNDVIGINTDAYSASEISQRDADFLGSSQKETDMQLTSSQSKLRVTCSYVKDTLKLVYISDLEGGLSLKQPVNSTIDMAKGLLERFQYNSGIPVYGEFASMLNGVEANKETTMYAENILMEVSGSEQNRISYKWTYVDSNGVLAEKKNVILIYEDGVFKGFFNNWPLYTIVNSGLKVSAEQATELAIKASENFSYPVTYDNGTEVMVSGFSIDSKSLSEAKLIYVNSVDEELARGGDPFRMYLAWYVPLGFDKFYPGDVSGMTVILWADTGEVCGMDRVIVDSGFGDTFAKQIEDETTIVETSRLQPTDLSGQTIGISAVTGLVFVSLAVSNKIVSTDHKKRARKFFGTLCISIVFSMIFISLPSANAASVTGKSRIYSCVGTQYGYNNTASDVAEENATAALCNFVGNASLDNGYDTTNLYSNTINTAVISNAGTDEQNYLGTMLFHAGHFSVPNEAYQDSNGNPIYASNIHSQTGSSRHFFVFLWVCVQAENHTSGTPRAWTHRDDLSEFGFNESDGLGQCYISFYGFSPLLSTISMPNASGIFYNFAGVGSPGPCYWFALKFNYYALYEGYSVHDSLDIASGEFFGCDYQSTVLNRGYHSWWPESGWPYPMNHTGYYPRDFNAEFPPEDRRDANRMCVFGDSNIYLAMPEVTLCSNYGSPTFYFDGNAAGTGNVKILRDTYSVGVSVPSGYSFNRFAYGGSTYYSNPSSIPILDSGYLEVFFAPVTPRYLGVISGAGGYTDPVAGTHEFNYGVPVSVTAYPDSGNSFDYWIYDGIPVYEAPNPVTITMNIDHSIQPVFIQNPPPPQPPTTPSVGGPSTGYFGQSCSFSASSTDPNGDNIRYIFNWGDGTSTTTGYYASGSTAYASHTWSSASQFSVTVTAEDSSGRFSSQSSPLSINIQQYVYLTISSTSYGTTTPAPGNYNYSYGQTQTVTANPNTGYRLDHWVLDGSNAGSSSSIDITMNSAHTLQAIYSPLTTYTLNVGTLCEEGFGIPAVVYVDGVPYPYNGVVYAGYHTIAVEDPCYFYGCCFYLTGFSDGLGNGATRYINSNTEIGASYVRYY